VLTGPNMAGRPGAIACTAAAVSGGGILGRQQVACPQFDRLFPGT
jgi:hypothetical protein